MHPSDRGSRLIFGVDSRQLQQRMGGAGQAPLNFWFFGPTPHFEPRENFSTGNVKGIKFDQALGEIKQNFLHGEVCWRRVLRFHKEGR